MSGYISISAKAARVNAGLSATKASDLLGIARATLCNYESGRTSPPWEIVEAMSELYNYPKSGILFPNQSTKSAPEEA